MNVKREASGVRRSEAPCVFFSGSYPLRFAHHASRLNKRLFNRIRPVVSQCPSFNIDGTAGRTLVTLHVNHQAVPADRPDPGCWNACISRLIEHLLSDIRFDRKDHTGLTFTEQDCISSQTINRQFYHSFHSLIGRGETTFSECYSQSTIRAIMGRSNKSFTNHFQYK